MVPRIRYLELVLFVNSWLAGYDHFFPRGWNTKTEKLNNILLNSWSLTWLYEGPRSLLSGRGKAQLFLNSIWGLPATKAMYLGCIWVVERSSDCIWGIYWSAGGYDISWRVGQEVNFLLLLSSRHDRMLGMLNSSSKVFLVGLKGFWEIHSQSGNCYI